jgi:hypothetical protein
MARITHVKSAQQRYYQVPVLNEDGTPKQTPVLRKDGTPKTTKKGRPILMRVTVADKSRPKPNLRCDFPGCTIDGGEILPGTPYKHVSPKSGPYGGRQRNRHAAHPSWQQWDLSNSISAQAARIAHDFWDQFETLTEIDASFVTDLLNTAAEEIRELAEQRRESAQNIEDGFGHAVSMSDELNQNADDLDYWADEVESVDIEDADDIEPEKVTCEECEGSGIIDVEVEEDGDPETDECGNCNGSGEVDDEDADADAAFDEWFDNARDACSVIDECPL